MTGSLQEYEKLALEVLRAQLTPHISKVVAREATDHAGDEALFFEAYLDADAPLDLGRGFILSHIEMRKALDQVGETRFSYLQTRRPPHDGKPTDFVLKYPEGVVAKRPSIR
jgi:hypothetical protein